MKKIISILTVLALCFAVAMPIGASAAGAGASLTGASSVRAGDTITLSFNISGNSIFPNKNKVKPFTKISRR